MATEAQREAFIKDNAQLFGDLYINLYMTLKDYGLEIEHTRSLQTWVNKMLAVIVTEVAAPASDDQNDEAEAEAEPEAKAEPAPTADGKAPAKGAEGKEEDD